MKLNEFKLKHLSTDRFVELGLDNIAYVRPMKKDGEALFVIHAADGTALVELSREDAARATIRQYEMEPLSLH